jgi:hypothetical protein
MKVKDLLKAFEDRGIHGDMDIRIIVNEDNPEDDDSDKFFNRVEVWGWGDESSVDLFVHKGMV